MVTENMPTFDVFCFSLEPDLRVQIKYIKTILSASLNISGLLIIIVIRLKDQRDQTNGLMTESSSYNVCKTAILMKGQIYAPISVNLFLSVICCTTLQMNKMI